MRRTAPAIALIVLLTVIAVGAAGSMGGSAGNGSKLPATFSDSGPEPQLSKILDEIEKNRLDTALEQAEWADGKATAGYQSAKAKHNLQLAEDHPLARQIGEAMLQGREITGSAVVHVFIVMAQKGVAWQA